MNQIFEINQIRFLIKSNKDGLDLMSFPNFNLVYHHQIQNNYIFIQSHTQQILSLNKNQVNILKPSLSPLSLRSVQQSFVDWSPVGALLTQKNVILYGTHLIVFYTRSNIMQKSWKIQVIQQIHNIRVNISADYVAMQVKQPNSALFLWNLLQPRLKPSQQLTYIQSIIQWQFKNKLLIVLTLSSLKVYKKSQNLQEYHLYHNFIISGQSFSLIQLPSPSEKSNKIKTYTLGIFQKNSIMQLYQLYNLQKNVINSDLKYLGQCQLVHKSKKMQKILTGWSQSDNLFLVCESQRYTFLFSLSPSIQIVKSKSQLGFLNKKFHHRDSIYSIDNQNKKHYDDPFGLPSTNLYKQLENQKYYPIHHPRYIQALIQTNKLQLVFKIINKVKQWTKIQQKSLAILQQLINLKQFIRQAVNTPQTNLSRLQQQKSYQQAQSLQEFSTYILDHMQQIKLKQKQPFLLESIISALSYYLKNNKQTDYFSQSILIQTKTPILKHKPLLSRHIAFLSHSINKQQIVAHLKPQKISWQWIKNNSIIFWFDNKQLIKKWIQEIALQQYKNKKQPLDCLFWYLLAGKKSLLVTLFKNHKLDSKQHEAIFNFLQRDFSQAKDRSAAVKNAYVLIDKKRYLHAMSFFILSGSLDDCVRLCVDRLKDLNLALLFSLVFKQVSNEYVVSQMMRGDVWMKHIGYKMKGKHILSYNCLFQKQLQNQWSYFPNIQKFNPCLIGFAEAVKNSIGVRRQIDEQNQKQNASEDIFADFYGDSSSNNEQTVQKIQIKQNYNFLKQNAIDYYLKQCLPLMALTIDQNNLQSMRSFSIQRFMLINKIDEQMQGFYEQLQDNESILKCIIIKKQNSKLIQFLNNYIKKFKKLFQRFSLVEVIKTKKQWIKQMLRYGYVGQKLLVQMKRIISDDKQNKQKINKLYEQLKQIVINSRIFLAIILSSIQDLLQLLEQYKEQQINMNKWNKLKQAYNLINVNKNEKHGYFSQKYQQQKILRYQIFLNQQETIILILNSFIIRFLIKNTTYMKYQLQQIKKNLQLFLKHWTNPPLYNTIIRQFKIIIKEGSQCKLKLHYLKNQYDKQFTSLYDIVALTHLSYFQQNIIDTDLDVTKDYQAIQIFRNKIDGLKYFVINNHDSKGLQCIIMFKKGIKKIQVCESIAKRQRSKDGCTLQNQDTFYTNLTGNDPNLYLKNKFTKNLQNSLNHIIKIKNPLDITKFPRNEISVNQKPYFRHVQAPYLDYNQLNSIQSHPILPFYLIGGKGYIDICQSSTMKNFDRIKCQSMLQIVKLHSFGHRIGAIDSAGTLNFYNFDPQFVNNCVYSIKKSSIIDFCYFKPSIISVISNSSIQLFDTLVAPKKQLKFKQNFTKDPLSISVIDSYRLAVLRKNDLLTYDIRSQKLESSFDLKGKGKCLLVNNSIAYIGQSDSKIKIVNLKNSTEQKDCYILGQMDEKERQKIKVQQIASYQSIILASTSEGSIYYLPKYYQ